MKRRTSASADIFARNQISQADETAYLTRCRDYACEIRDFASQHDPKHTDQKLAHEWMIEKARTCGTHRIFMELAMLSAQGRLHDEVNEKQFGWIANVVCRGVTNGKTDPLKKHLVTFDWSPNTKFNFVSAQVWADIYDHLMAGKPIGDLVQQWKTEAAATSTTPPQLKPGAKRADVRAQLQAQAKAEWDRNVNNCRQQFYSEQIYIGYRAHELQTA
jgi:hypothetical protein